MDKFAYMKEMTKEGMAELLLKGGFCPERVDIEGGDFDESLEPFAENPQSGFFHEINSRCEFFRFEDDAIRSCECDRESDSDVCRRCIVEFLDEEIGQ